MSTRPGCECQPELPPGATVTDTTLKTTAPLVWNLMSPTLCWIAFAMVPLARGVPTNWDAGVARVVPAKSPTRATPRSGPRIARIALRRLTCGIAFSLSLSAAPCRRHQQGGQHARDGPVSKALCGPRPRFDLGQTARRASFERARTLGMRHRDRAPIRVPCLVVARRSPEQVPLPPPQLRLAPALVPLLDQCETVIHEGKGIVDVTVAAQLLGKQAQEERREHERAGRVERD